MPHVHGPRLFLMFSTRSLMIDLVRQSNIPACLSTIGVHDSRYVSANDRYLQMIERIWPEIENKDLVSNGSAIDNPQRDRRLWLLDAQGYYDSETAEIRVATGRIISVQISSQRVWCSGTACDVEFFRPLASANLAAPGAIRNPQSSKKALLQPSIGQNLKMMALVDKRILVSRILSLAAEGAILASQMSKSENTKERLLNTVDVLENFRILDRASQTRIGFDFSDLDYCLLEDLLLQFTGEIWMIILCCKEPDVAEMLRYLVAEYTRPKPLVVSS